MKKLIFKSIKYTIVTLALLEVVIRVFHLGKDTPIRFIDDQLVEKWLPNQYGITVTGNRNQNFSEFKINESGFNSFREFSPQKEKIEIALVGDSFFQGFHQDYFDSIGAKMERELSPIEVYEYAYAGYDFADQLHLIHAYERDFKLIDQIIIYLDYSSDLERDSYSPIYERMALQSPLNLALKKSKLIVYTKSIGLLSLPKKLLNKLKNKLVGSNEKESIRASTASQKEKKNSAQIRIKNFSRLIEQYGFDKKRFTILLNSKKTDSEFLNYLKSNRYEYIDFHFALKASKQKTTLIYDKHWNNNGREIISKLIVKKIISKLN